MVTSHGVQAIVGLTGLTSNSGGYTLHGERVIRIELPESYDAERMKRLQKDFELIAGMIEQHPDDIAALHNAVLQQDSKRAGEIAAKVGLDEGKIVAQGGGAWAAVGIAVVVLVGFGLLLAHDTPPVPEPPTTAPADAGIG
jgi:hypothetical protein